MESSTTVPMTSTNAKSVSMLMEKPAAIMKANVPTSETTMPNAGMSVAGKSCTKRYTTTSTKKMANKSVKTTSRMEAKRKSLVLSNVTMRTSFGNCCSTSFISLSISWLIRVALEPATWLTLPITPGWPLMRLE